MLHLALAGVHGPQLFQPVAHHSTKSVAEGILLAALMVIAVRIATGRATEELRVRRRILWIFSLPYVAFCLTWGLWNESPRLVMPIVRCENLLATATAGRSRSASLARGTTQPGGSR